MKKFAPIAIFVLTCLSTGVLVFPGCGRSPQNALLSSPPPNGTSLTFEVDTNNLAAVKDVLVKRFAALDERFFWEQLSETRARIVVASGSSQKIESLKKLVSGRGQLEFRLVHPDSDKLAAINETPSGYQLLERELLPVGEVQPLPGAIMTKPAGQPERRTEEVLVKDIAEPGLSGNIVKQTRIDSDPFGHPNLMFELTPEATTAFAKFTRENIGHRVAIMIDGEFYSAPKIMSPMTSGGGVLTGSFSQEEVLVLAVILNSPLPVSVRVSEAKP